MQEHVQTSVRKQIFYLVNVIHIFWYLFLIVPPPFIACYELNYNVDPPKMPINLKSLLQQMETDFDAPVPYNPQSAKPLANTPIVDDECYMGKDGNAGVCVDFGKK